MKKSTLFFVGACLLPARWLTATAQSLDPSFAPSTYFAPATAYSTLEQADGKRIVLGSFTRADGSVATRLVRYTTTGAVDAAFQQNVGTAASVFRVGQLATGQLLLTAYTNTPLVVGGLTRNGLLRLNADGTADATFDPGTGPSSVTSYNGIDYALPLPNGQVLVGGFFDHFNGVAVNNLVRLNADGSVDTTFQSTLGTYDEIETMAVLANGQYLIGGFSQSQTPGAFHNLARLNSNGSLDATFNANLADADDANYVVVQPDGKILVAGLLTPSSGSAYRGLVRLLPDGSLDPAFNAPSLFTYAGVTAYYGKSLELQPDGKILVLTNGSNNPGSGQVNGIVRLHTDGTLDASFQTGAGANNILNSFTRLANGSMLTAGSFTSYNGALDRPVVQLTSTGTLDATFSPVLQVPGSVSSLVRQADGKLIIGGNFSELNGQSIRRLARLNSDGTLDASFATGNDLNSPVGDLALQPDGRLLLIGNDVVRRLLPTGALDNTFTAPNLVGSNMYRLLLQPDGKVLIGGNFGYVNGTPLQPPLLRLNANGAYDASFAPNGTGAGRFVNLFSMTLQPDGKLVVAGNFAATTSTSTTRTVARLESTGALDASFTRLPFSTLNPVSGINTLAVQPDGKVLAGGQFTAVGGTARTSLARLNTDGTLDAGFTAPFTTGGVNTLLVQANGSILVGGSMRGTTVPNNLARLLPSGQLDTSFSAMTFPNGTVSSLLLQPDGKLLLTGSFTTIAGQASAGVARLTGTNVLTVRAPQTVADHTQTWPVPAHTLLQVAPDASAHPLALDLVDGLGRAVRSQALSGSIPTALSVEGLPTGLYLLRVTYAEGQVVRRIAVQ